MANVIHFFEYLEYEDLEKLDIVYKEPIKGDNQTYISYLENPVQFYLPKSEIIDIYQDDFGRNIANYLINITEHVELLTFLENFDTLCIDHAALHSEEWFKKSLSSKVLLKYYNTIYSLEDEEDDNIEQITVDIEINDARLLDRIDEYNKSDTLNVVAKIEGIEFFKQTFKWKIILENIVDGIQEYDSESESSSIDFNEVMDSEKELQVNTPDLNDNRDNDIENTLTTVEDSIENDKLENDESNLDENNNNNTVEENQNSPQKDDKSIIVEENQNDDLEDKKSEVVEDKKSEVVEDKKSEVVEDKKSEVVEDKNSEVVEDKNSEVVEADKNSENLLNQDRESQHNNNITISVNEKSVQTNLSVEKENKESSDNKSIRDVTETKSISCSIKMNDEVINDLADVDSVKDNNDFDNTPKKEDEKSSSNNSLENSKIDTKTLLEIETIINDKRIEAKKYLLNAERAKRASQALSEKAAVVTKEVSNFEEKLRNLSQTSIL